METLLAPAGPVRYDLFSDSEDYLSLPLIEEFTGVYPGAAFGYEQSMLGVDLSYINRSSPVDSPNTVPAVNNSTAASDPARSPAQRTKTSHPYGGVQSMAWRSASGIDSGSGSSVSPETKLILTPVSTLLDYNASVNGDHPDDEDYQGNFNAISPAISYTTDDSFVLVPRFSGDSESARTLTAADQNSVMNNRPPLSTSGVSGASARPSRASSVAPSTVSFMGGQWGSFTSTADGFVDHHNHPYSTAPQILGGTTGYGHDSSHFTTASQHFDDSGFPSDADILDESIFNLPFRSSGEVNQSFAHNTYQVGSPFAPGYPQIQQHQQPPLLNATNRPRQPQPQYLAAHQGSQNASGGMFQQVSMPTTSSLLVEQDTTLHTVPKGMEQGLATRAQPQSTPTANRGIVPTVNAPAHATYLQPPSRPRRPPGATSRPRPPPAAVPANHSPSTIAAGPSNRPLHPANVAPALVPSNAPARLSHANRRGGRPKQSHLPEQARQKSHRMRKMAACWRCALQRDPCDEGTPCGRCVIKSQKGQTHFFDCNRSKLPGFVHDFLPPSMTLMHQKQTIEDCVNDQVLHWDHDSPLDVYLTSGYGPALRWPLYEFKPKSDELLNQLQYLQDPITGSSRRHHKYSPPFGLLKLDSSDEVRIENYLEQLLDKNYLWDLGWSCFEEETQVDEDAFQAKLLDLMCNLYLDTQDVDLKDLLKEVLRMMVITYIMGHTLTILEDTLPTVLNSVKLSPRPKLMAKHTSPRLANRQLKFFFHVLRSNIYEKVLKWQQQTLHTSGKKEETWLPAFCATLGFAMVLEEVQRTIQIQADAKATKNEMSPEQATTEARYACDRIDDKFAFLVGLFQCKYRDRKWGENGSFGNQTPEVPEMRARKFLSELRQLVEEKRFHLESRKDVPFGPENQCQYTSRLVARFLLPFLGLPQ